MHSLSHTFGIVLMTVTATVFVMTQVQHTPEANVVKSVHTETTQEITPDNFHDKIGYHTVSDKNSHFSSNNQEKGDKHAPHEEMDLTLHDTVILEEENESETYRRELLGEIL